MTDGYDLYELEAIKRLKYAYMRCIDQKLWDELEGLLTEDVTCAYSSGKLAFDGREAVMGFLKDSMGRDSFLSSHRVHHPEISFTSPAHATGVWALEDLVIDTQGDYTLTGAAFYRDEYVKVGDDWKIRHTGYTRTFEQIEPRAGRGLELTHDVWRDRGHH